MEGLMRVQKHLQTQILNDYTNFQNRTHDGKVSRVYIEVRLESLENRWKRFESNHFELLTIEELRADCSYLVNNIYEEGKEIFFEYKSNLREYLLNHNRKEHELVTLPQINIPIFSGQYEEWPTFHDLFETIIHRNSKLANVEKLYYLKAHITGDPEQLLRHVPITAENYEKCWELINRRYSNTRYLANEILMRLFGQKNITAEKSKEIKRILDTTNECLSALSNLGFDISTWDLLINHIVTQKLDQSSKREWEQKVSDSIGKLPTYMDLTRFLEAKFRTLEILEMVEREPKLELKERKPRLEQRESELEYKPTQKTQVFHVVAAVCVFCKGGHKLDQCQKFRQIELRLDYRQLTFLNLRKTSSIDGAR